MPSIHRRLRPYRPAGLYRGRTGPPQPPTPTQQRSLATLRDQLVADHLHDDPTAGQSVILDLLTFAKIRHSDATSYPLTRPPRIAEQLGEVVHALRVLQPHDSPLVRDGPEVALVAEEPSAGGLSPDDAPARIRDSPSWR
jgi:hypothetical protein